MAYGFKLGDLTGLTPAIKEINLTLKRAEIVKNVTLSYHSATFEWDYSEDGEMIVLSHNISDGYYLTVNFLDESDVGNEYEIILSVIYPSRSFAASVNTVVEAITVDVPQEFISAISSALMGKANRVIAADGKPCLISDIVWDETEATNTQAFQAFYDKISLMILNISVNAYVGDCLVIQRYYDEVNDVRAITVQEPEYATMGYHFAITYKYSSYINSDQHKIISCDVIATLITDITSAS